MKTFLRVLFFLATGVAAFGGTLIDSTYTGPVLGDWSNPSNWSSMTVPNNGGGNIYNVMIHNGKRVQLDLDVTINTCDLAGSSNNALFDSEHQFTATNTTIGSGSVQLTGYGTINLGNLAEFSNQTLNSGDIRIDANMPGQIAKVQFNGADIVNNYGLIRVLGADARFEDENGNSALRNFTFNGPGAQFRVGWGAPDLTLNSDFQNAGHFVVRPGGAATFTNGFTTVEGDEEDGLVEVLGTDNGARSGNAALIVAGKFGNQNVSEFSGKFELTSYGGATATLQYNDANIVDFVGRELGLQGQGAGIIDQSAQDALRNWSANHCLDFGVQIGARTQNISGNFDNAGVLGLVGDAHVNVAGNLTSSVLLALDVWDLYQVVSIPGFPPSDKGAVSADLTVMGNLTLTSSNDLWVLPVSPEIIDKAVVHGTATLGGTLTVIFSLNDDSAAAEPGAVFTLLQSDHPIAGEFSNVASGGRTNAFFFGDAGPDFEIPIGSFRVDYIGNELTFSDYQRALPAEMANLSTRLDVQTDDQAGIAGFIVDGTEPKQIVLRGIGPSLNISGQLEDPVLDLRDATGGLIESNDDWRLGSQAPAIIAAGLAPANDRESAVLRTLSPGAYTAIVRGKNETAGIGLAEVYDIDQATGGRLANLSTRGVVETGNNVLIGGLIAGNPFAGLTTLVARAIGPSLTQNGIPNALQDPVLELHDADGAVIAANDNWMSDQQAEIEGYGLGLSDPREAALVFTTRLGPSTVVVRGAGATTGVGLLEIYNVGAPARPRPAWRARAKQIEHRFQTEPPGAGLPTGMRKRGK